MQEEEEPDQMIGTSSPPIEQPVLLTPTKQVSKDNHLLTTLHCSRQLVFVLTPTKQEPQMFSSLLSEEKSGMIQETGLTSSRQMHQQRDSEMQAQNESEEGGSEEISQFQRFEVEEEKDPEEPEVSERAPSIEVEQHDERQHQEVRVYQTKTAVRVCNCRRSGCLKKYCECFKAGQVCSVECECISCNNIGQHNHQNQRTKSAARMSCNCKKSECSKNYCECHSSGNLCWEKCKCRECKNTLEGQSRLNMLAMLSKTTAKKRRRQEHDDD